MSIQNLTLLGHTRRALERWREAGNVSVSASHSNSALAVSFTLDLGTGTYHHDALQSVRKAVEERAQRLREVLEEIFQAALEKQFDELQPLATQEFVQLMGAPPCPGT